MDRSIAFFLAAVAALGTVGTSALGADRTFHTFVISEVYSSIDGKVQFVELRESLGMTFQNAWAGHALTATNADGTEEHVLPFTTNLPNTATASKRVLIATANFASLPGGITPDYIIPPNFLYAGGGVNFAALFGGADVTYTALPTNGQQSLVFPGGTVMNNTPTNFAGQGGVTGVNVPPGSCCVGSSCTLVTSFGCTGTFTVGASCTPNPCAPPPTGACCVGAACTVQTSAGCAGTFQGAGSACGTSANPTTCCKANFNQMGGVTVQDIFDFLAAYFDNNIAADFNGVGGVTVQDIFDFLAGYFAGCTS